MRSGLTPTDAMILKGDFPRHRAGSRRGSPCGFWPGTWTGPAGGDPGSGVRTGGEKAVLQPGADPSGPGASGTAENSGSGTIGPSSVSAMRKQTARAELDAGAFYGKISPGGRGSSHSHLPAPGGRHAGNPGSHQQRRSGGQCPGSHCQPDRHPDPGAGEGGIQRGGVSGILRL